MDILHLVLLSLVVVFYIRRHSPHRWQEIAVIYIFLALLYCCIYHSALVVVFYRRWAIAGYTILLFFLGVRYLKRVSVVSLVVAFMGVAVVTDTAFNWRAVSPIWKQKLDRTLRRPNPHVTYYPYGDYAELVTAQGFRYPELARREFSFIGNRQTNCEKVEFGVRKFICSSEFNSYPFGFWTPFFLTKPYVEIFRSQKVLNEVIRSVRSSYTQGWELEDATYFGYSERPLCSFDGYMMISGVDGEKIQFTIAGSNLAQSRTLPVLFAEGMTLSAEPEVPDLFTVTSNPAGMITVAPHKTFLTLVVRAARFWQTAVLLYWLPFAVFLFLQLFRGTRLLWMGLRR